ncbi:MAG: PaaI family thioesterase [Lachnospiraceae bacterium]|nr:PaaI family thioesterase [Lachnospiraceae bacterium]
MESKDLEKVKAFFKGDIYALDTTGIVIEEADKGFAVCSLMPREKHVNADGVVQGGAIYTLADFCFAIAANADEIVRTGSPATVTLSANVSYLRPAKLGEKLIATARCIKNGRTASYYEVKVAAETAPDKVICAAAINGMNAHGDRTK